MKNILLATSNLGKLKEFQDILNPTKYHLTTLDTHKIQLPEETGSTFVENAIIKSRAACQASGLPSIADDSGLIVPVLKGAPGIYSARFAGKEATEEENREKLLRDMKNIPEPSRHAYFQCVIVFMESAIDPAPLIAQASWHGIIADTPRGENGFGYDSLFYVPVLKRTAAELSSDEKNTQSHRALALQQLLFLMQSL